MFREKKPCFNLFLMQSNTILAPPKFIRSKKNIKGLIIFFQIFKFCIKFFMMKDILAGHDQLLVVTTQGWAEKTGELVLYERANDNSWKTVQTPIPVVLGKNG